MINVCDAYLGSMMEIEYFSRCTILVTSVSYKKREYVMEGTYYSNFTLGIFPVYVPYL